MSTVPPTTPPPSRHFTPFRSAAEEAALKIDEDEWNNEGGHMSSTAGRIVRTPDNALPYTVVMSHGGSAETERDFATIREAEAFIRRNTPVPAARRTLYDRAAGDSLGSKSISEVAK